MLGYIFMFAGVEAGKPSRKIPYEHRWVLFGGNI
jgi:hypothetical protein